MRGKCRRTLIPCGASERTQLAAAATDTARRGQAAAARRGGAGRSATAGRVRLARGGAAGVAIGRAARRSGSSRGKAEGGAEASTAPAGGRREEDAGAVGAGGLSTGGRGLLTERNGAETSGEPRRVGRRVGFLGSSSPLEWSHEAERFHRSTNSCIEKSLDRARF